VSLDDLRDTIDSLDQQILDLLVERARKAKQVGDFKADGDQTVYVPEREAQVLRGLLDSDLGPLDGRTVAAVFREIISACRGVESQLRISFLGPEHTFTHVAARKRFGSACTFVPAPSIPDVFRSVESGQTDFGVVPIQNSTEGTVGPTLDAFLDTSLRACAELYVPIHHYLMGCGALEDLREVHSHPQVLAQCRNWLRENLPGVALVPTSSSSAAAAAVAEDCSRGAIAPEPAAEANGLAVLASHIEDLPNNRTRFFVIGDLDTSPTGMDKTSIVFSTPHRAGALHQALGLLARHGLNLTMIQSRPAGGGQLWEYVFFVDFTGHADQSPQTEAIAELRDYCALLKVLGSYPEESEPA